MNRIGKQVTTTVLAWMAAGCTSVTVDPLPPGIPDVLIIDNPKVVVPDFIEVMRSSFEGRGIATRLVREEPADSAKAMVTFSARQSWDFGAYLSQAEVVIRQGGRKIGYAEYHLIGKGGLSLMKWDSVATKMNPVFDELLANYPATR